MSYDFDFESELTTIRSRLISKYILYPLAGQVPSKVLSKHHTYFNCTHAYSPVTAMAGVVWPRAGIP